MSAAGTAFECLVQMGGTLYRNTRDGKWYCYCSGAKYFNTHESPVIVVERSYKEWCDDGSPPFRVHTAQELREIDEQIKQSALAYAEKIRQERMKETVHYDLGGEG